jgi:very-short-patch-repair endonuclease
LRREIIPYNPKLKQIARKLRNNSTLSEILLWKQLRGKQIMGYDFHRQKPLDEYIVDFLCNELMLAVEIDGDSHRDEDVFKNDVKRQKRLEEFGISFLRFTDIQVKTDIRDVMDTIDGWIELYEETHPAAMRHPSQEGN